jgi:hypothetical protein
LSPFIAAAIVQVAAFGAAALIAKRVCAGEVIATPTAAERRSWHVRYGFGVVAVLTLSAFLAAVGLPSLSWVEGVLGAAAFLYIPVSVSNLSEDDDSPVDFGTTMKIQFATGAFFALMAAPLARGFLQAGH